MSSRVTNLNSSTAQEIVNWVANDCRRTFVFTPPTRRNWTSLLANLFRQLDSWVASAVCIGLSRWLWPCRRIGGRRGLRSSASITTKLATPRTRTTFGDRTLAVAGLLIVKSSQRTDVRGRQSLTEILSSCHRELDIHARLFCTQTSFIPTHASHADKPDDSWIVLFFAWILTIFADY